jgi:hypothetical protein
MSLLVAATVGILGMPVLAQSKDATPQTPNTPAQAPGASTQTSPAQNPAATSPGTQPIPPEGPGQALPQGPAVDQPGPNHPSLITSLKAQPENAPYVPVTARQRLRWFVSNSIAPSHLAAGVFTSAFGTALDRPKEYGPHWGGFADRYGMRMTGVVTGNAIEASAGALWGEDPRYFRVPNKPFGSRVKNAVKQTFMARRRDGDFAPAYARFIAVPGNNFLSNEWRVSSEASVSSALLRTAEGFAGRMASNAFEEFWPDIQRGLLHHNR